MKFKKRKKGLLIGMSAVMIVSAVTPSVAQAATWKQNRIGWWWEDDDGSYPVSQWKIIGGKRYYFDQSGYMKSGWYKEGSDWYYLGAANDGAMKTGWQKVNGIWYYLNEDGKMATGWKTLGANTYYLDKSGAMHTGWLYEGSNWYYLGGANDGAMKTGWQSVGGKWYYMYDNGKMAANTWIGDWYVDGSGAWTKTKEPAKWIKSGNRWWYRHEDGGYTTNGFEKIGGQTYYFDAAGWMVTGWRQINNKWYYFDASGAMKTNAWIGDYYVGADGVMATDTWIGEWYVDNSGKWVPGKVKEPVKEPEKEEIALKSISLDKTSVEMWAGEELTLQLTCNPENTTVDKTVTWSSSDKTVATVENGKVKAVGKGTATITAEVAGKKATCEIKAEEYYHFVFNMEVLPVNGGEYYFDIIGPDGYLAGFDKVYSLDESIAVVELEHYLKGVSDGTVTIMVVGQGGKTGSMTIDVKKGEKLQNIYFNPGTYSMKTGDKLQLEISKNPGNALVNKPWSWKSSNPEVAEVDYYGVVRAMGEGETTITCTTTEILPPTYGPNPNEVYYDATCTIKVDGIGNNNELEKIVWQYTYPDSKYEIVKVGDIVTPNITVYPVTYPCELKDFELSIISSGHVSPDGFIPEEGIVEIIDGNRIKICKPGNATVKAVLNGKETTINFLSD